MKRLSLLVLAVCGLFLSPGSASALNLNFALKNNTGHAITGLYLSPNDLLRPALYGSHHEIMLLPGDGSSPELRKTVEVAVAGPLCEAGDVFTVDAGGIIGSVKLNEPKVGDLVIFRDTGAYGSVMSSNYNSRPLSPEVLIEEGNVRLIRRRQTMEDLLELEKC